MQILKNWRSRIDPECRFEVLTDGEEFLAVGYSPEGALELYRGESYAEALKAAEEHEHAHRHLFS